MENNENIGGAGNTQNKNSNKAVIIVVILLIVAAVGYYVYKNSNQATPNPVTNGGTSAPLETTNPNAGNPNDTAASSVKEFTVSGSNYKFAPNTLAVKKGDTVKITFVDTQGMHNFK